MCGIAGYCDFTKNFKDTQSYQNEIINKMGETLQRRGPDDDGVFLDEHVAFAHRRLAVIDPKGGAQPMMKRDGSAFFVIVYNGSYITLRR